LRLEVDKLCDGQKKVSIVVGGAAGARSNTRYDLE
jgi:hypothetical protein